MRFTKHLILTIITALAATLAVACTPSPTPDEALVEMYQEALHDAQALTDSAPGASALRMEHADEITAEIERLCGFTDDRVLPESCTFSVPAIAAAPTDDAAAHMMASQEQILGHLEEIPTESVPLIIGHYIDQARLAPPAEEIDIPEGISLKGEDLTRAQDLLATEYAAAWALGVALAYVSPDLTDATQEAIDRHRGYAAVLRTAIDPFADTAPSEPGYDLTGLTEPTDPDTALALIREVQDNAVTSWHNAASVATDPAWRLLASRVAGSTARDTVAFA